MSTRDKDILEALSQLSARVSELSAQISKQGKTIGSFDRRLVQMHEDIKSLGEHVQHLDDDLPS
jgi:uncharacterized coiled-coil protein SlyX